jgi:hypothetical protein
MSDDEWFSSGKLCGFTGIIVVSLMAVHSAARRGLVVAADAHHIFVFSSALRILCVPAGVIVIVLFMKRDIDQDNDNAHGAFLLHQAPLLLSAAALGLCLRDALQLYTNYSPPPRHVSIMLTKQCSPLSRLRTTLIDVRVDTNGSLCALVCTVAAAIYLSTGIHNFVINNILMLAHTYVNKRRWACAVYD